MCALGDENDKVIAKQHLDFAKFYTNTDSRSLALHLNLVSTSEVTSGLGFALVN